MNAGWSRIFEQERPKIYPSTIFMNKVLPFTLLLFTTFLFACSKEKEAMDFSITGVDSLILTPQGMDSFNLTIEHFSNDREVDLAVVGQPEEMEVIISSSLVADKTYATITVRGQQTPEGSYQAKLVAESKRSYAEYPFNIDVVSPNRSELILGRWSLLYEGSDVNMNAILDPEELGEVTSGIAYSFFPDHTGLITQQDPVPTSKAFHWNLAMNDSMINLQVAPNSPGLGGVYLLEPKRLILSGNKDNAGIHEWMVFEK